MAVNFLLSPELLQLTKLGHPSLIPKPSSLYLSVVAKESVFQSYFVQAFNKGPPTIILLTSSSSHSSYFPHQMASSYFPRESYGFTLSYPQTTILGCDIIPRLFFNGYYIGHASREIHKNITGIQIHTWAENQ